MKKTLVTLFAAINLTLLYCQAAFALTEDEAAAAVDTQGKDAVSGNLFLWLLCAIAFMKVSTKLDGILHSLGIGVSRSPGSMLSEALLAFRGFEIGRAFMGLGAAKAAASTATAKATPSNTFAGGLSGMVSRHVQQSTASSISGQSGGIGASLGGAHVSQQPWQRWRLRQQGHRLYRHRTNQRQYYRRQRRGSAQWLFCRYQ